MTLNNQLNFQQTYNVRTNSLQVYDDSKYKVGKTYYVNRLTLLKIKLYQYMLKNDKFEFYS